MNSQALEINKELERKTPVIASLLSQRGKNFFYPKKGLLLQTAEAKNCNLNSTAGIARDDNNKLLCYSFFKEIKQLSFENAINYSSSYGKIELREIWVEEILRKNPSLKKENISFPVVTHAITNGLFVAGSLFVDPNDEIILPDLYWENYELIFKYQFGAKLSLFPFFKPHQNFRQSAFNFNGLQEKLNGKGEKKIILFNFPNNPTGYTLHKSEIEPLKNILLEAVHKNNKKIVVILDDAYFGLFHTQETYKESLFSIISNLSPNILAIKLDGATKEDFYWGGRVGFITFGYPNLSSTTSQILEEKSGAVLRASISNSSSIGQELLRLVYESPLYETEKTEFYQLLKERFLKCIEVLENNPQWEKYFTILPFNSGYSMTIKLKEVDSNILRIKLIEDYNTGVVSVGKDIIRLTHTSVPTNKIANLFNNIVSAIQSLT